MIEVKHRYVNIKIDIEKIRDAFEAVCDDAHDNCAGSVRDMIYLSYHQCADDKELRDAQALLRTIETAQEEGCVQSDEEFDLQKEYDIYFEKWEAEQKHQADRRNRPSSYGTKSPGEDDR